VIKNPAHEYLVLDGMPYVIDESGKRWVFARTTSRWVPADDEFDAVYPNWDGWWSKFEPLPELPAEPK
jgi:hypothetical protein